MAISYRKSNQLYTSLAGIYDLMLWVTGYKVAVHYFVKQLPFKDQQFRVLDAGSGTGLYTFAILSRFPHAQITAFDLNAKMIHRMHKTVERKGLANRVRTFVGDVIKPVPNIEGQQFDLIVTGGVLEYVNITEAIKNLSHYLKSGGYFLNSPVKDNWLGKIVGKLYKFTPYARRTNMKAFTQNGYALEKFVSLPIIKEAHLFKKL